MKILLVLVVLYLFLVYIVSRFIVPNYGWKKSKLPEKLPEYWQKVVDELKQKSFSQDELLKNTYQYITTHYKGGRFKTILNLPLAFQDPFSRHNGYLQCHIQNYLLRVILVKSGYFSDDDIQVKFVVFNFFTHQYLKVKVGEKWIDVDPHESYKGVSLGKHSEWLG